MDDPACRKAIEELMAEGFQKNASAQAKFMRFKEPTWDMPTFSEHMRSHHGQQGQEEAGEEEEKDKKEPKGKKKGKGKKLEANPPKLETFVSKEEAGPSVPPKNNSTLKQEKGLGNEKSSKTGGAEKTQASSAAFTPVPGPDFKEFNLYELPKFTPDDAKARRLEVYNRTVWKDCNYLTEATSFDNICLFFHPPFFFFSREPGGKA